LPTSLLGIISALIAAAAWGGGDFFGGFATRRVHPMLVLVVASAVGAAILLVFAVLRQELPPSRNDIAWAAAAGFMGGLGLLALYRGLASGPAATVAPVAAVVGTLVPVLVSIYFEGLPSGMQFSGFLAGIGGIWLVTSATSSTGAQFSSASTRQGLLLAVLAGIGFGAFFSLLAPVSSGKIFYPLAAGKLVQVGMGAAGSLAVRRRNPALVQLRPAVFSGALDAFANAAFMFAIDLTRLDVASVLASLYPVGTVFLSSIILKERVTARQWAGVGLCAAAVALIAI
jgi:drug/metabolite transporter (DMT)-like permease